MKKTEKKEIQNTLYLFFLTSSFFHFVLSPLRALGSVPEGVCAEERRGLCD
jgi:hypothetical protein